MAHKTCRLVVSIQGATRRRDDFHPTLADGVGTVSNAIVRRDKPAGTSPDADELVDAALWPRSAPLQRRTSIGIERSPGLCSAPGPHPRGGWPARQRRPGRRNQQHGRPTPRTRRKGGGTRFSQRRVSWRAARGREALDCDCDCVWDSPQSALITIQSLQAALR